ncbi:hypothetical protein HNY73_016335 [Argiope bruennichi]|uniref:Uncharacterized protein n=1 Tax=Argiope bruennichi TaxID=94029 RepID=A0A8T0EIJ3_ARGBR|nr:hypothetical protein HNY73_016335 [Argiope bruennichi]
MWAWEVPLRFDLRSLDTESRVRTISPQNLRLPMPGIEPGPPGKGSVKAQLPRFENLLSLDKSDEEFSEEVELKTKLNRIEDLKSSVCELREKYCDTVKNESEMDKVEDELLDIDSRIEQLEISFQLEKF